MPLSFASNSTVPFLWNQTLALGFHKWTRCYRHLILSWENLSFPSSVQPTQQISGSIHFRTWVNKALERRRLCSSTTNIVRSNPSISSAKKLGEPSVFPFGCIPLPCSRKEYRLNIRTASLLYRPIFPFFLYFYSSSCSSCRRIRLSHTNLCFPMASGLNPLNPELNQNSCSLFYRHFSGNPGLWLLYKNTFPRFACTLIYFILEAE